MNVQYFINEINNIENINLKNDIHAFEKKLKKCFKLYSDNVGFEDYKMNELDYIILYTIWKSIKKSNCIDIYLVIMYSYYKLEEFYFPINKFINSLDSIKLIMETNVISIINGFINLSIEYK